jgi:hypothetical protein
MYMYFSTPIPFGQYYLISDSVNRLYVSGLKGIAGLNQRGKGKLML